MQEVIGRIAESARRRDHGICMRCGTREELGAYIRYEPRKEYPVELADVITLCSGCSDKTDAEAMRLPAVTKKQCKDTRTLPMFGEDWFKQVRPQ